MLKAAWRGLIARRARLLLSVFAIVLGVAFVAGSLIFTQTLSQAFAGVESSSVGDVIVRPAGTTMNERSVPAELQATVASVPGVKQVDGQVLNFSTYVLDKAGRPFGLQGAPGLATNFHTGSAAGGMPGLQIVSGRAPTAAREIGLDPTTARTGGYRLGDDVVVVTSTPTPTMVATLVGFIRYGGGVGPGASLVTFDTAAAQKLFVPGGHGFQRLWVVAQPGVPPATVRDRIAARLPAGYEAVTGVQVAQTESGSVRRALAFVTVLLLIFAGVALLAGGFLIMNTFSMLVAQRSRELALWRALGASRRQVTGSVLLEALVLGITGSLLGLASGIALAAGIKKGFGRIGLDLSATRLVVDARPAAAAVAVGVVVTVLAAYLPARRSAALPPVRAMRDDVALSEPAIRRRTAGGIVLLLVSAVLLSGPARARLPHPDAALAAGLATTMLGTLLLAPALCRGFIGVFAVVARPLSGGAARLAEQNAIRQPRRTAATAGSLIIGLTLIAFMTVIAASATASVDRAVPTGSSHAFVVAAPYGAAFSATYADRMQQVDGVAAVTRIRQAAVSVTTTAGSSSPVTMVGTDPQSFADVFDLQFVAGSRAQWTGDSLIVSDRVAGARGIRAGDTVEVGFAGGQFRQRVAGIFRAQPAVVVDYLQTLSGMNAIGVGRQDRLVYVTATPAADTGRVRAGLQRVVASAPMVAVQDQAQYAAQQRKPIDQLLRVVYALLGLTLIIALLGILNTLALAVVERHREIGLLRAIAMTRPQVRAMIRVESLLIAVLASLLGIAVGTLLAVAVQRALADRGISVLSVPWSQLAGCAILAVVIGVLAAWWPARQAARIDVLAAINAP